MLIRIHMGISVILSSPHWELEPEEATKLHEAITNLTSQYGFDFDPRTKAWIDFMMCAGAVYGPRIMAQRAFSKLEAKQRREAQAKAREQAEAPEQPEPVERNNRPADANGNFGARPGFGSVSAALEGVTHPSQIPGMRGAAN